MRRSCSHNVGVEPFTTLDVRYACVCVTWHNKTVLALLANWLTLTRTRYQSEKSRWALLMRCTTVFLCGTLRNIGLEETSCALRALRLLCECPCSRSIEARITLFVVLTRVNGIKRL